MPTKPEMKPQRFTAIRSHADELVSAGHQLYADKLGWFKQHEKPEAVLLVADNSMLTKIVVAWTLTKVRCKPKPTPLRGSSEYEVWEWLW